jgi:formate dehydrogenase assembly factor FdhD
MELRRVEGSRPAIESRLLNRAINPTHHNKIHIRKRHAAMQAHSRQAYKASECLGCEAVVARESMPSKGACFLFFFRRHTINAISSAISNAPTILSKSEY